MMQPIPLVVGYKIGAPNLIEPKNYSTRRVVKEERRDLARLVTEGLHCTMPSSPADLKINQISPPTPPVAPSNTNVHKVGSGPMNGSLSPSSNSTGRPTNSPQSPSSAHFNVSHHMPNAIDPFTAGSSSNVRQISKLRRFLSTLYQFAFEISNEVADRVRLLIIGLVSTTISTEEFHQKIQEVTNYPLRPYVIPFLKLHLPILQNEIAQLARLAKISPTQYIRQHETLILDPSLQGFNNLTLGEQFEIFQPTEPIKDGQTKRKSSPDTRSKENGFNDTLNDREAGLSGPPPAKRHQPMLSPTMGTRISPAGLAPLLLHGTSHHSGHHPVNPPILNSHISTRSMFEESASYHNNRDNRDSNSNGRTHSSGDHLNDRYSLVAERFEREFCRPATGMYPSIQREFSEDRDMEDEWKNINTMLNCILGMVEKTKRALAILQHRSESLRSSELASVWNLTNYRGRHSFNHVDIGHSNQDYHDIKKPRVDNLLSVHYPKNLPSEIDRLAEIRRTRSGNHQLEEAVNEVKRQAVAELQKAVSAAETKANELVAAEKVKMEKVISEARKQATEEAIAVISHQDDSVENCWNCGRKASETCSGCNVARYCGSFCQHKDWENHHKVCQNTNTLSSNNNGTSGSTQNTPAIGSDKRSKSRSPTPALTTPGNCGKNASAVIVGAGDSREKKEIS